MRPIHLTARFRARRTACGVVSGSREGQALGATIAALSEAESLPGVGDVASMMPPTTSAFVRRVPGHNLWVWYRVNDSGHLVVLHVTRTPPISAE